MVAIRLHALLNDTATKTYISGAPTIFEAVKALEAILATQSYKSRVFKAEWVEID